MIPVDAVSKPHFLSLMRLGAKVCEEYTAVYFSAFVATVGIRTQRRGQHDDCFGANQQWDSRIQ